MNHSMSMSMFDENPPAELSIQGDLFVCDIASWQVKDDIASMGIPLFSLAKNKDTQIREYRRGNKVVRIIPSTFGAANVFDKDILLFAASQLVEAMNKNAIHQRDGQLELIRPPSRVVKINSLDFLVGTDRSSGGASYDRILDMLRRLKGTNIETNIETGGVRQTEGFSLIEHYKVIESTRIKKGALSFSVTLSEWLYNSLLKYQVLTLDRGYFSLTRAIERRLYEIARQHCGDKPYWKLNIDLLAEKVGTSRERFKFRSDLREVMRDDAIPEYRLALDTNCNPDNVVFYTRNSAKLSKALIMHDDITWFSSLERGVV